MPESFAKVPITTAPPAAMLIHYVGFILAIFSICPLAFFFHCQQMEAIFSFFFFFPVFASGGSGLAIGAEPIAKKKTGATSFRGNIQKVFFLYRPLPGCNNQISTHARSHTYTNTKTHTQTQ